MREATEQSTGAPQIAHKLFKQCCTEIVDNLFISFLLLTRNDPRHPVFRLYVPPVLPTMKSQLLQLPLLVGSGRVSTGRALFSCLPMRGHEPIQVLMRSR